MGMTECKIAQRRRPGREAGLRRRGDRRRPPEGDPDRTSADRLREPEDYTAGPKRSPLFVFRRTVREFLDDGSTDLAAALTYFAVLAIFPGLIALLSLVGMFGQAERVGGPDPGGPRRRWSPTTTGTPGSRRTLTDLASMEGLGLTLVVGLLGALWAASGLRRRLQPRHEQDLRGGRGPAVLAVAADAGHRHGHQCGPVRGRAADPDHQRTSGRGRRQCHRGGGRPGRDLELGQVASARAHAPIN